MSIFGCSVCAEPGCIVVGWSSCNHLKTASLFLQSCGACEYKTHWISELYVLGFCLLGESFKLLCGALVIWSNPSLQGRSWELRVPSRLYGAVLRVGLSGEPFLHVLMWIFSCSSNVQESLIQFLDFSLRELFFVQLCIQCIGGEAPMSPSWSRVNCRNMNINYMLDKIVG